MKKLCILTGILLFVSSLLNAQKIKYEEYDLDNGLHVILHEDHSAPVITLSVLYHVGSKNEKPGRTGFAHFFEHLMFEGSKYIKKRGDFFKYIKNAGGYNNANTSRDRTYYYETLPSNQLPLAIWLESERMLHAKVEKIGIETQREVVKEEKRMTMDNQPYAAASRKDLWNHVFPTHPYRNAVIGSMKDINAAKEDEFQDFYHTYYVPNNATLTVAGDINPTEAKRLIAKYFGTIPRGTKKINRPNVIEEPILSEKKVTVKDKNAQLPALIFAYRAPKQTDKDSSILSMISAILSSGRSSRIQKNVVNKKHLAVQANAYYNGLEDYGIFYVYALPNKGVKLDDLQKALDVEIDKLVKNGISEKELQIQINKLKRAYVETNSSSLGIAQNLAYYHVFFGDTNLINTEIDRYQSITLDDVKRVVKKYLNPNQRIHMTVIPSEK